MSRIVSFRGLLADGGQERISLQTIRGVKGYKILKFQVLDDEPGEAESANAIKIYKILQSSVTGKIDFSDNTLLAAIDFRQHNNEAYGVSANTIIVDNEIFNQDIYITNKDNNTGAAMNYYFELEAMDLALDEATVATLKDIRNTGTQ